MASESLSAGATGKDPSLCRHRVWGAPSYPSAGIPALGPRGCEGVGVRCDVGND